VLLQNVPVERICEVAEALAKNTHLEKLHLANTRATDKVANVRMTVAFCCSCIDARYLQYNTIQNSTIRKATTYPRPRTILTATNLSFIMRS